MGRAKLTMELISKEKSRNITFQKRKQGLIKKAFEFTTLCDVSACVIIYAPDQNDGPAAPEIWPPNPHEVKRIINAYKSNRKDSKKRTCNVSDYFEDRKKKIEEELIKARQENLQAKYPTWFDFMANLPVGQLREFANALDQKLEVSKARVRQLISGNSYFQGQALGYNDIELLNVINHQNAVSSMRPPVDEYPTMFDHGHVTHPANPSPMMMLMMDGLSEPIEREFCYDHRPLMHYFAPVLQPMPPYVQCPLVGSGSSQVHASKVNEYDGDYQMKNQGARYY
ncbi:hypothetical protein RJ640_002677 [Escallonia rubra]|uniref:MADS-box domain-containing protein n=1 Tax=Escallonia rubra TaxID=112253 RepID=A0AA88QTF7_9ASTE|nr:hypothetical protein RJ640_002677 [Escallonia rubra]